MLAERYAGDVTRASNMFIIAAVAVVVIDFDIHL
jgi:hypothetical protein